jgi:hypothetical protein
VTSELKPLIYDKTQPRYLREMMMDARLQEGPRYDIKSGLAKHRALIASGAAAPDWMNQPVGNSFTGVELFTRVIGVAAVPMVITGALWGVWMLSSPPTNAKRSFDPSINTSEPAAPVGEKADQARPLPSASLADKSKDVAGAAKRPSAERADDSLPAQRPVAVRKTRRTEAARPPVAADQASPSLLSDGRGERTSTDRASSETTVNNRTSASPVQPTRRGNDPVIAQPASTASVTQNTPSQATQPAIDSTLQREIALLAQARRFAESRPLSALALVQEKAPKTGLLKEEWDQVYLLSLVKLGRVEEARQAAQRFQSRYPNSAFNERLHKELPPSAQ